MNEHIPDPVALESLWAERFPDLPKCCGTVAQPGTDEVEEWRDWTERPTTQDQVRIEEVLTDRVRSVSSLLHVGVGNSGLAQRFARRVDRIVGTTITVAEQRHGSHLAIPNYSVHLINKYSNEEVPGPKEFDFIIDNNPTAFGCCRDHLMQMMTQYHARLKPNGMILTDRRGLGWVTSAPGANARWAFSAEDWAAVGRLFNLRPVHLTDSVIALVREDAVVRSPSMLRRTVRAVVRRLF